MATTQTRRKFLWKSALASSAAAVSFRFEEQALIAQQSQIAATPAAPAPAPLSRAASWASCRSAV